MNGLADLRDVHYPEAIGFWPPAPGWWLLMVVVLSLGGLATYYFHRRWRHHRARRAALTALQSLEQDYRTSGDRHAVLAELSILVRRTALAYYPRTAVAGLAGDSWRAFLRRQVASDEKALQVLTEAAYQANEAEVDMPALFSYVRRLLIRLAT